MRTFGEGAAAAEPSGWSQTAKPPSAGPAAVVPRDASPTAGEAGYRDTGEDRPGGGGRPGFAKPGPWRVLLWKEWRQQRWTFLGMTALALGLFVLGGTVLRRWSFALSGAAHVFALLGVPLVLSARAFAGEDDDGTAAFLQGLPFRPLQVFASKFAVVLLASWGAAGLLSLLGWRWRGYPDDVMRCVWGLLPLLWMVAPVVAVVTSLVASLNLRTLTTALLSAAQAAACAFLVSLSLRNVGALRPRPLPALAVLLAVPGVSILLAVALSCRRHPRRLVQFGRAAVGCLGVVVLFGLPAALAQLYLDVLATPAAYLCPSWFSRGLGWVCVSVPASDRPDAIAIECQAISARRGSVAVLDLSTHRVAWLDRQSLPFGPGSVGIRTADWSPDGSRLSWLSLVPPKRATIAPVPGAGTGGNQAVRNSLPGGGADQYGVSILDLETGKTRHFPGTFLFGTARGVQSPWYDDHTLAMVSVREKEGMAWISFLDADAGTIQKCTAAAGGAAAPWEWLGVAMASGRGVYAALRRRGQDGTPPEVLVARCTPGAPTAMLVHVVGPVPRTSRLRQVSMDGRWALLVPPLRDEPEAQLQLVDLASGTVRPVELPSGVGDFQGERRRAVCVHGFVVGSAGVLVSSLASFAVYDLGQGAWVSYTMPTPEFAVYTGQMPPISPDGRRVFQVFRGGSVALNELPAAGQGAGSGGRRVVVRTPERRDAAETYAVVVDLQNGQMTKVPLAGFERGPTFNPTVSWLGNDHILVLSSNGICRYGLDGSREVLYP